MVRSELITIKQSWERNNIPIAIDPDQELCEGGILGQFFDQLKDKESVDLLTIRREVVLQNCVGSIINELSSQASKASV